MMAPWAADCKKDFDGKQKEHSHQSMQTETCFEKSMFSTHVSTSDLFRRRQFFSIRFSHPAESEEGSYCTSRMKNESKCLPSLSSA